MTRAAIVAASEVVRAGLEAVVKSHASLEAVGGFADVAALERGMEDAQPDVVLLDVETEDALDASYRLAREYASAFFIILAADSQGAWARDALRSGVRAILERGATAAEIVSAVEAVGNGLIVVAAETLEALLPAATAIRAERAPDDSTPDALTNREIEVLGMLAEGLGNKMIAYRLGISEHTVKFHLGSIFGKLGVSGRTEAVTLGIRRGLIMI